MKTCSKCKIDKPLNAFNKNKCNKKDGLSYRCRDCSKAAALIYTAKNKEKKILYDIEYRKNNKQRKKLNDKLYYLENKEALYKYSQEYKKRRSLVDNNYRLREVYRSRLKAALKYNLRSGLIIEDLGCTVDFLRNYLEDKFEKGMSWSNYGWTGWHLDHIEPLASVDLTDPQVRKRVCHYTNIQPLWAKCNYAKGSKGKEDWKFKRC